MALTPQSSGVDSLESISVTSQPNKTYKMQIEAERILGNTSTPLEAIEQACYKALNTERYAYAIYSWNYGIELQSLFGKPYVYAIGVLPQRISDCLLVDDRIQKVDNFDFKYSNHIVTCTFTVTTYFGETLNLTKEVTI